MSWLLVDEDRALAVVQSPFITSLTRLASAGMTSPASRYITTVAGRSVKIVRGAKSQTVNICTPANEIGLYDVAYRLAPHLDIPAAELTALADLDALKAWLLARDGDPEVPARAGSRATTSVSSSLAKDDWVATAQEAVDRAVTTLVQQFLEAPYLHRVEHSLHTLLHRLLVEDPHLAGSASLRTGQQTQLVHKEWPETVPRQRNTGTAKRGNFDIGVIAPTQAAAADLDQFRAGRIDVALAVEVGLDYGRWHLRKDAEKLLHSDVRVPYLLHLSRVAVTDRDELEADVILYGVQLRTAYAHIDPRTGERRVKHIADDKISIL